MVMMECQDKSPHAEDVVSLAKDFHLQVQGTGPLRPALDKRDIFKEE